MKVSYVSRCIKAASIGFCLSSLVLSHTVLAAIVSVSGKVIFTQGHQNAACREVAIQDASANTYVFRIPNLSPDTIGAVFMAAVVTGVQVDVFYDPTVTTGCGTEPAVQYVTLRSP